MVIVGAVSNGHVYLGGDSCGAFGALVRPYSYPKVWTQRGLVMGFSGRVREQQILRYCTETPEDLPTLAGDMLPWICGPFIDAIRAARKAAGFDERIDGQAGCEYGPVLMVGGLGRLFALHGDYSVAEYPDGGTIGSGETAAWGSLTTTAALGVEDPRERVRLALEAACAHDIYCRPPFTYVSTEGL